MITFSEIKKAINAKLKEICPDVAIYGKEVSEGERKPCFYPYIMPKGKNYETRNFVQSGLTLKVTYMQDQKDEADMLEKQDALEKGFGMSLKVGNRSLLASDVSFDYVGLKQDILQFSVTFNFTENIHMDEPEAIADGFTLRVENKEE